MPARGQTPPNPRSRISVVGRHSNSRTGRPELQRRQVGFYPCPKCLKRMYADEVIDLGTVELPDGTKRSGRFHRECPEE